MNEENKEWLTCEQSDVQLNLKKRDCEHVTSATSGLLPFEQNEGDKLRVSEIPRNFEISIV